jgi:hypothetical protein
MLSAPDLLNARCQPCLFRQTDQREVERGAAAVINVRHDGMLIAAAMLRAWVSSSVAVIKNDRGYPYSQTRQTKIHRKPFGFDNASGHHVVCARGNEHPWLL